VHLREVDVTGIDNHELNSLKLVDAGQDHDQQGPVIGIFRQYAYHGVNRTIHLWTNWAYKNHVDDRL
jgi:hypothetical protein